MDKADCWNCWIVYQTDIWEQQGLLRVLGAMRKDAILGEYLQIVKPLPIMKSGKDT